MTDIVPLIAIIALAVALVVVVIAGHCTKRDDKDRGEVYGEKKYRAYRDGFNEGRADGQQHEGQ